MKEKNIETIKELSKRIVNKEKIGSRVNQQVLDYT